MTDVEVTEQFIDDFLAHWGIPHPHYDPRKAHEYYMRTRKLVGREAHKLDLNLLNKNTSNAPAPRSSKIQAMHGRLDQLEERSKKLHPDKRNIILREIDAIRKKLHKIHNPFGITTKVDGSKHFRRKIQKSHTMDINPNARLDTSQIIDKRAKNDPTRGSRKRFVR